MLASQSQMKKAAYKLSPMPCFDDGLKIYFLTGKNFLYQTLFCIYSIAKFSEEKFQFVLVDDGSFDETDLHFINSKLPGCLIITKETINDNLAQLLPIEQFPYLHHKRKVYPHIKKLTDVHSLRNLGEWKLVIDSDMLFWAEPAEIISWLKNPTSVIYMKDCEESYGFNTKDMETLCGNPIPDKLNVGVIGINSTTINWEEVEGWAKKLEVAYASYYLEQALSAMIVAGENKTMLPAAKYIVNPNLAEIKNPIGFLHHYVDLSKAGYFNIAWKNLLKF